MPTSFSWIIWPYHESLGFTSDEFVTGEFRVRLQGNGLTVETEQPESEKSHQEARQLAKRYIGMLGTHLPAPLRLITIEELAPMPAQVSTVRFPWRDEIQRFREAKRRAREELLASGDPTLRRCYAYLDEAREHEEQSLSHLYKVIDAIENEFSGEQKAVQVLRIGKKGKKVKQLASEPARDERHAPKRAEKVQRPSPAERAQAMKDTIAVLRAYERHVMVGKKKFDN